MKYKRIVLQTVLKMSDIRKRERASNFEKSEIHLLTELVTKFKSVLENKKTDAVTNKEKEAAWSTIATTFNAASSGHAVRTPKALKLKYEGLKKSTKKKMTLHRQELYRTGGGTSAAPAFDDVEEKVLAICSNISGLDSRNDSDNFTDKADTVLPDCEKMICDILFDGATSDSAGILSPAMVQRSIEVQPPHIEEEEAHGFVPDLYDDENTELKDSISTHPTSEVLKDGQNKWGTWNPKALKSKISPALKPSKTTVTAKLDQLSTARLELVKLQKEIAHKEHLFKKEEHELKLQHLRNEEQRKKEIHELMLLAMHNTKQ